MRLRDTRVRIPEDDWQAAQRLADAERSSVAAVLRRALATELRAHGVIDCDSPDEAEAAAAPLVAALLREATEQQRVKLLQLQKHEPERLMSIVRVLLGSAVRAVVEDDTA